VSAALRPGEARLFSEQDRLEVTVFSVAGGELALFSARSPAKETPNEDAVAVIAMTEDSAVLAVADGLGGAPSGQHASAVAVESLEEALREAVKEGHDARWGILNGFERANERVLALGVGAGTTLTVAELSGRSVRAYHVGDSFVLVTGGRGKTKLQTIPHSPVGYGVESGLLDEKDAMHHEERHIVSNAIGSSDLRIDVGLPLDLAARDTLLVASDGLSDNLHTDEIVATVRKGPLRRAARRLAEGALDRMKRAGEGEPSKPDDLTFVLFRSSSRRAGPR
jgi:serine/threonine protein phosphatase PrpC